MLTSILVSAMMIVTSKLVKVTRTLVIWLKGGQMPLKNTLKIQRAKLGINQGELGRMAEVSRQTISSIERGEYNPSIVLVLKLSRIFQVSVEELFSYDEESEHE